jgi:hypothetical protein
VVTGESLPKVQLSRMETLRLAAVGLVVAFMLARVVPDAIRLVAPIGLFGYATNDDGVVIDVPETRPIGTDPILLGDRVRIDRIAPFDRKPGLARDGFSLYNFDRKLPVDRAGKPRILKMKATAEPLSSRALTLLRILLYVASVAFGALLFIVKPRLATLAFFAYCLGRVEPTTFTDVLFDQPWREIPRWIGDTFTGAAPVGLLVFAMCLAVRRREARLAIGTVLGIAALAMGTLYAADSWRVTYAALPAEAWRQAYAQGIAGVYALTVLAFAVALARARGAERQRTGWMIAAFALSSAGAIVAGRYYPASLHFWQNGVLISLSILPVIVVWIGVAKHHFFDIDFVVSRALVYSAITAAVVGIVASSEELLTYIFYNNTDLAYGLIIAISLGVGAGFGKVRSFLEHFVDRFIFRGRHTQRTQLERVASNLLDAEETEIVWSALLHDVPSILDLSFSGIMLRTAEGGYELIHQWQWPPECVGALAPDHQLTRDIHRTRGILGQDAVRSTMVKSLFPNDRLTYAAPLYIDRSVGGLVFYGHSVSGLDLDPVERGVLGHVVANASIALNAIELARYRAAYGDIALAP